MVEKQMEITIRHVLVVDDDDTMCEYIKDHFELSGVQVSMASDGAEALKLVHDGAQPDVILSDIKMANMDGFALLQSLRAVEDWNNIPFIIFSGYDNKTNLQRAFDLGADGFLKKDVSNTKLLEAVQASLKRVRVRVGDHQPSANGSATRAVIPHPAPAASPPLTEPVSRPDASPKVPSVGGELRTFWRVLLYHKWRIFLVTLVAVIAAVGMSQMVTPMYDATATIRVASAPGGQFDYGATMMATRLGNTYVEIATSDPILETLNTRLQAVPPPAISVSLVPETELLEITARHPDPAMARDAANTLAEIMAERSLSLYAGDSPTARQILAEQLDQTRADLDQAVEDYIEALSYVEATDLDTASSSAPTSGELEYLNRQVLLRQEIYGDLLQRYEDARVEEQMRGTAITIVEPASLPGRPASPNLLLNTILAVAGGLVGGGVVILVLESLNNTIRNSAEIQGLTAQPILARIPNISGRVFQHARTIVSPAESQGFLEDAYQSLLVRLQLLEQATHTQISVLLVTSPEPGTGKSTIAANLALTMIQQSKQVILVDTDFYNPSLHGIFNLPQGAGLSDVLRGNITPQNALQSTAYPNLHVLTAGNTDYDIFGLMSVASIQAILSDLRAQCDYLIIDSPGLLTGSFSTLLAKHADAALMVVAERHTDRDSLKIAMRQLSEIDAKVAGVVINRTAHSVPYKYQAMKKTSSDASLALPAQVQDNG